MAASQNPAAPAVNARAEEEWNSASRRQKGTTARLRRFAPEKESLHGDEPTAARLRQLKTKTMGQKHWIKRSRQTGEFMDQKKVGKFKSVRREKDGR